MIRRKQLRVVISALAISVCVPVLLCIWFINYQTERDYISALNFDNARTVTHIKEVVGEGEQALNQLDTWKGQDCSDSHLRFMRRISYTWPNVQETISLSHSGTMQECSSMENHGQAMSLPSTYFTTKNGFHLWFTTDNDLNVNRNMVALASAHHMVMLDPISFINNITFNKTPINLAVLSIKGHIAITKRQPFDMALWYKAEKKGDTAFIHKGYYYNFKSYPELGIVTVIWSSVKLLQARRHHQMLIWLPLIILFGLIGFFAILKKSKNHQHDFHKILKAINSNEFQVHYQPIVLLSNGKMVGAEALARWPQKDGSYLPPDTFIPLAKETHLITLLTRYVIKTVFVDLGDWLHKNPQMRLSINIEANDLGSKDLQQQLSQLIKDRDIEPQQIALELTEKECINVEKNIPIIRKLRSNGHAIHIDDFGTGYSNLSYLQDLDIDAIKIDKSFIGTLDDNSVTSCIIDIAKSLHLQVIAEGIETEHQRQWLQEHGVQFGQGWLFSKALPKSEFLQWVNSH